MTETEYLRFRALPSATKTGLYSVDSRRSGERLALIKWYGPWRQYTLWPEPETIWNPGCLRDVNAFIATLMAERAKARTA